MHEGSQQLNIKSYWQKKKEGGEDGVETTSSLGMTMRIGVIYGTGMNCYFPVATVAVLHFSSKISSSKRGWEL